MIQIEKGVPMPKASDSARKYPWREMEVGDSFVVPFDPTAKPYKLKNPAAGFSGAISALKSHGLAFAMRKQRDGSLRVWRVK
jgi:hypothetical protein